MNSSRQGSASVCEPQHRRLCRAEWLGEDVHSVYDDRGMALRLVRQHGVGEARMWVHAQSAEALVVPVIFRRILTHDIAPKLSQYQTQ